MKSPPTTGIAFTRDLDNLSSSVTGLEIIETRHGFYAVLSIGDEKRYLTTRREPGTPRMFLHLITLHDLLRESFTVDILIHREEPYKPQIKTKKKSTKKRNK